MYGTNSILIVVMLLVFMAGAVEGGYRLGLRRRDCVGDAVKSDAHSVQASMLGFLALLLGFSFSLALQRFDSRSEALVDEANAIGTTYLRSYLLPEAVRGQIRDLLQRYVELRVKEGEISLADNTERQRLIEQSNLLQNELWNCVRQAAEVDSSPVRTGLFIQTLNETIDSFGRRDAQLNRHIPEEIIWLLFLTFLLTGGAAGYAAGIVGHRPVATIYVLIVVIAVQVFIIIDLDRPRRGWIKVDHNNLVNLLESMKAAPLH